MSDIVRDTWVDSYKSVDRSYDALRQVRNVGDPSGIIVHQESNSFRSDRPLVQHFTQMLTDKENIAARTSILGVNHLTQAINIEKANEVKEVQRRMGNNMSLEKQNELFPNNLELRMKKKLDGQLAEFRCQKILTKNLDQKLQDDKDALMH